jgi:tetratricopeptide (TPR) repeat protein
VWELLTMMRTCLLLALPLLVAGTPSEDAIRRGNAAYGRGDFEGAAAAYAEAEIRITDPGLAAFNKAAALYQNGRHREAERAYRGCLEDAAGVRRTYALYGLGTALVQQGRERGADVLRDAVHSYELCLRQPDIGAELADDVRHNIELAKLMIALIPPKSSDRPDSRPEDKEDQPKPPPERRQTPDVGMEPLGQGKADSRGDKQRVRRDQGKDAQKIDEGAPGASRELPPVPDQEDLAPMAREDAQEHLKRAALRILSEQRAHQSQRRLRGSNENGLDW